MAKHRVKFLAFAWMEVEVDASRKADHEAIFRRAVRAATNARPLIHWRADEDTYDVRLAADP